MTQGLNNALAQLLAVEDIEYFKEFIKQVNAEREFHTMFFMQNRKLLPNDPRIDFITQIVVPTLILEEDQEIYIKWDINSEIFAIVFAVEEYETRLFDAVAASINHIRPVRVFVMAFHIKERRKFLHSLMDYCEDHKIINLLVNFISNNWEENAIYHQLQPFPWFHWSQHSLKVAEEGMFYPPHWRNMMGKTLYTLPDQVEPRSMVFVEKKGQQISGFVGKLLTLFAQRYNATLKFPFHVQPGEVIHSLKVENYTHNGILDIGMSLDFAFSNAKWQGLSYPIEVSKWSVMVPCSQLIPLSEVFAYALTPEIYMLVFGTILVLSLLESIFLIVLSGHTLWLNFFLNDKILPGMLGSSITLPRINFTALRFIYGGIFLLGLFTNSLYSAHLKTLITTPSYQSQIETFDDLRHSPAKLLFDYADMPILESILTPELEAKLQDCMVFTSDTAGVQNLRKSLNTTHSYTVTVSLWNILQRQQHSFIHKVFCRPEDLTILNGMLMAMPLQENSPYKEGIDLFIHFVHANGLIIAWLADTFHDMVRTHQISLEDSSEVLLHIGLKVYDLYYAWFFLLGGLSISFMLFLTELFISYMCNKIKNIFAM